MTRTSDHDLGVRTDRRIGEVDAIRRIALFGILITNVVVAVTGIRSIQGGSAARPSPSSADCCWRTPRTGRARWWRRPTLSPGCGCCFR